jgi:SPP1 gp7 family putative phage head morphogenesis protein
MNSQQYWQKREEEQLKHRIIDEKDYEKRVKEIYEDMLKACETEINAFYGRYADKENITLAEAKKRVSALDIKAYERKAKKYVKDRTFTKEANEEMRLYNLTMKVNRLEMLKANIGLELVKGHGELEQLMADILKDRTEDELKRQAGILGETIKNNTKLADSIVNASFHNATFSDRVWQYHDMMKADLSKLLQSSLIRGKSAKAVASDLRKYFIGDKHSGGAVFNMERLMRTELARVQTGAQKQSFEKNGFELYRFICNVNPTKGNHTCTDCERLANAQTKYGKGVYLVKDMMPGTNAPPMHPQCRCSTAAYEDSEDYEEWLESLANGDTTEEWNKKKKIK